MKLFRILALMLVLSLSLGIFAGCGKEDKKQGDSSSVSESPQGIEESKPADKESKPSGNTSAGNNTSADKPVPTLIAKDNGDGTVTISSKLPSGIGNGLIVITVSDKLSYIEGSAASEIGTINDTGAFNGIGVSFATATLFDEGTTTVSINYELAEGESLSEEDFWCDYWELGDGTVWLSKKGEDGCEELKVKR